MSLVDDKSPNHLRAAVNQALAANRELLERLDASERRHRRLARAVWRVQEDERRRIARELHDDIGQTLTALSNHLQRLGARLEDETLREGVRDAVDLTRHALEGTRELSRLLRPAVLDDLGLAAGLRWLARFVRERSGLDVEVRADFPEGSLDGEQETLVFRVVQEALTNVIKHAEAKHARVLVEQGSGALQVEIRDDGKGFDPASVDGTQSSGITGMKDRLRAFGGHFVLRSEPSQGTSIMLRLPVSPGEEDE